MEIGKPIKEADIPTASTSTGRYKDIYDSAENLSDGEVLPVVFEDRVAAMTFANGTRSTLQKRGFHTITRRATVYISRRNS